MVQTPSPLFAIPISVPTASSNGSVCSVEETISTTDIDRAAVDITHDSDSTDGSCSGLAEIQIRAINFFSAHSNISIPTDIQLLEYTDANESTEDDPVVANPDPSFDRDNPYSHISVSYTHLTLPTKRIV